MTTTHVMECSILLVALVLSAGCRSTLNTSYNPSYSTTYSTRGQTVVALRQVADRRSGKPAVYYQNSSNGDTGQLNRPVAEVVREAILAELNKAGLKVTDESTATAAVSCEIVDFSAVTTEPFLRSAVLDLRVALVFEWEDLQVKTTLSKNERSERRSRKLGMGNVPVLPFDQEVVRDFGNELVNDLLPRVIEKELQSHPFLRPVSSGSAHAPRTRRANAAGGPALVANTADAPRTLGSMTSEPAPRAFEASWGAQSNPPMRTLGTNRL